MGGSESGRLFFVLLLGVFLIFFQGFPAERQISSCSPITEPGSYFLSNDLTNSTTKIQNTYPVCLKINASNVRLDCRGFSITEYSPSNSIGIFAQGFARNITIENCPNISGFETGIHFSGIIDGGIRNSGIFGNLKGVYLASSGGNSIALNNFSRNPTGIGSYNSENNEFVGNRIFESKDAGIAIEGSLGTVAPGRENLLITNILASGVKGIEIVRSGGNILLGNILSNFSGNAIHIRSASKNNVSGNEIYGSKIGIFLETSYANFLSCNYFANNAFSDIESYYSTDDLRNASCSENATINARTTTTTQSPPTSVVPGTSTTVLTTIPACSCGPWVLKGCNFGGCPEGSEYSERVCAPAGCAPEKSCIINHYCYVPPKTTTTVPAPACPPNCEDNNPCTRDFCSNNTGFLCSHSPYPEGFACGSNFVCSRNATCDKRQIAISCPVCNPPTEWSECDSEKRTRQVNYCGPETGYFCVPYSETEACAAQTTVPTTSPTTTLSAPECKSNSDCPVSQLCSGGKCKNPKLTFVFVPVSWNGSREAFIGEAEKSLSFFVSNTPLSACPERVKIVFGTEPCPAKISCKTCGEAIAIRNCAKRVVPAFDIAVGLTDNNNLCGGPSIRGFSCKVGGVFVKSGFAGVLAHEAGHEFGLRDEYCNYGTKCGALAVPNPLKKEYGCDPESKDCCSCSGTYSVCCQGNLNAFGGRSIMSYANAPGPRAFDEPSLAHLRTLDKMRCDT